MPGSFFKVYGRDGMSAAVLNRPSWLLYSVFFLRLFLDIFYKETDWVEHNIVDGQRPGWFV
jgi:hypothetical protein